MNDLPSTTLPTNPPTLPPIPDIHPATRPLTRLHVLIAIDQPLLDIAR
jgi:hypothetical protein